jgi:hypothetical protein
MGRWLHQVEKGRATLRTFRLRSDFV